MKIGEVACSQKTSDEAYEVDSLETIAAIMKSILWLTYKGAHSMLLERPADFFAHAMKNADEPDESLEKIDEFIDSDLRQKLRSSTRVVVRGRFAPKTSQYREIHYLSRIRRNVGFPGYVAMVSADTGVFNGDYLSIAAPYFGLKGAAEHVKIDCTLLIEEYGYAVEVGKIVQAVSQQAFFSCHELTDQLTAKKVVDQYMDDQHTCSDIITSFAVGLVCPHESDSYAVEISFDNMTLREAHGDRIYADGLPSDFQRHCDGPPQISFTVKKIAMAQKALTVVFMTESERIFAQTALRDVVDYLQTPIR